MIVGSGDYRYRVNADWAKLPEGWSFKEVGGVGVDSRDNVYVFNRGEHPMMIFDRDGNFLNSWGEGQYPRAHGVHVRGALALGMPPVAHFRRAGRSRRRGAPYRRVGRRAASRFACQRQAGRRGDCL